MPKTPTIHMHRFGLDNAYLDENHVSGANNVGKHASFSLSRGIHICQGNPYQITSWGESKNAAKDSENNKETKFQESSSATARQYPM